MGDEVACPVCERNEVHFFITLGDLDKHLTEHHIDTPIQWECAECEKSFPKLHGARCHIPKCRGPTLISEIALLKELDLKFKDHKYPNFEIRKVLTTKTIDQIKCKRKTAKSKVAIPISNIEESLSEWTSDMINEIEALTEVPPQVRDMYDRINSIWSENKTNKEALIEKVNEFIITHVNRTLKNYNKESDKSNHTIELRVRKRRNVATKRL
jgi:hypothetical protein